MHCPVVVSTMEMLKGILPAEGEVFLVTADEQTAGRGQRGTSWESETGKNLTFSFLFRPFRVKASEQFFLSEIVCLAVAATLDAHVEGISVKWPNDVYRHDRKICGMLLEHTLSGSDISTTLVGIGINVNQSSFRSDAPNPVSIRQITGHDTDLSALLSDFVGHFENLYALWCKGGRADIAQTYWQRLYRRQGFHDYEDVRTQERFQAEIAAVAPNGRLTLRLPQGEERTFAFKEVCFL